MHKGLSFVIAIGVVMILYFGILGFGNQPITKAVSLYYYNTFVDQDENGNARCSPEAVLPVTRQVSPREDIITNTIDALLRGELSAEERAQGFMTEFPHEGFRLKSAELYGGVLTLTFEDRDNFTTGGACRVTLLHSQIEKTALQFPGVAAVRFLPSELFQP